MTIEDIIGIIIVGILVGLLLADLIFAATWNKTYFTSGLTVFVQQIPVNHYHTNIPSKTLLEKKFHSNVISSLMFKEMDTSSYGFRDKLFQFKWIRTPDLMHGLLIFDTDKSQIVVKGFTNWFTVAFSLLYTGVPLWNVVLILSGEEPLGSLLFYLGIFGFFILMMGIMYLFQASRFSKIASYAAESWARKHLHDDEQA